MTRAAFQILTVAVLSITAAAQPFHTLLSFNGTDGGYSTASLIQGSDGSLYGTASDGGTYNGGTVFRITTSGTLTTLYNFCAQPNCADGTSPWAALALGADGNFYGTTVRGGTHNQGTVFKITPAGALTTLVNFDGAKGEQPLAGLLLATDGNFYGVTTFGGVYGEGAVFKLTPSGALKTLYSFCPQQPTCTDGVSPSGTLVEGRDGSFYGTTQHGGIMQAGGSGTVFKITRHGALTTLYTFCSQTNCADGSIPYAGLVEGREGDFYGTTLMGGSMQYYGTAFKISPAGKLTVLHSFCTQQNTKYCTDGNLIYAGLIQGTDGNFYGTAYEGGDYGWGALFKITPSGTLTTLHSFDHSDGNYPMGAMFQASNGVLYGTTTQGNPTNNGTIYSLTVSASTIFYPL